MAGKHRATRACWRVRLHKVTSSTGVVGQHVATIVGLHIAAYAAFESGIKHVLSVVSIGH